MCNQSDKMGKGRYDIINIFSPLPNDLDTL